MHLLALAALFALACAGCAPEDAGGPEHIELVEVVEVDPCEGRTMTDGALDLYVWSGLPTDRRGRFHDVQFAAELDGVDVTQAVTWSSSTPQIAFDDTDPGFARVLVLVGRRDEVVSASLCGAVTELTVTL